MNKNFYCVTSPTGNVNEYFDNRNSAIAFIVDEFAMVNAFRYDDEGDRLTEYLCSNDETPNQYPYKYFIKTIRLNTEYNSPNKLYMVKEDAVRDGEQYGEVFIYHDYNKAKEIFERAVKDDMERVAYDETAKTTRSENGYERWQIDGTMYCMNHYCVYLVEVEDNGERIGVIEDVDL